MLMRSQHPAEVFREPVPKQNCTVKPWSCIEIEQITYQEAWDLQKEIVSGIFAKSIENNIVLILQHSPVFTVGRRGEMDNFKVTEAFLEDLKIPVIRVERGGDITFHGPGQLVVYPIVNLRKIRTAVRDFVAGMEETMIRIAKNYGVKAERNNKNPGVWVDNKKLGSLGIAIRHGISFHGFALNVNMSLEPFEWINPCGLNGICMTSLLQEGERDIPMSDIREAVRYHMKDVFHVELESMDYSEFMKRQR